MHIVVSHSTLTLYFIDFYNLFVLSSFPPSQRPPHYLSLKEAQPSVHLPFPFVHSLWKGLSYKRGAAQLESLILIGKQLLWLIFGPTQWASTYLCLNVSGWGWGWGLGGVCVYVSVCCVCVCREFPDVWGHSASHVVECLCHGFGLVTRRRSRNNDLSLQALGQ